MPTIPDLLIDPKHWRERAEEARVHAEQLNHPEAQQMMLEVAAGYERLARKAEERLRNPPNGQPYP